jgi:putative tricarboxylic transport membrane protein
MQTINLACFRFLWLNLLFKKGGYCTMKKKSWLFLITLIVVSMVVAACGGGGQPESQNEQPSGSSGGGDAAPTGLSQEEVLAEIDRITAAMNDGSLTEAEGVAELQAVIPKPDGYPKRNIEYVIGWGEGGGSDRYARGIAREAEKIMGTRIIPNNMPGGAAEVALAYMLSQPADGYTIYGPITSQVINEALGEQPYNFTEDVTFIIRNQGATEVFWVKDDSPFQTWEDVVAFSKANPGKLTITGAGSPGDDELRVAELNEQLGTDMVYIPSQASGERTSSLLGGHIHVLHETAGAVIDLYHDGQIRPVLVPSDVPFEGIDAPTTKELGLHVSVGRWRGITAPAGLDPEIQRYLHNVFYASSKMPDYLAYEKESYLDVAPGYLNSEDFKAQAEAELVVIKKMLKDLGYID